MALPQQGLSNEAILENLDAKRINDVRWQEGRAFGMVFDGGDEIHQIAEDVALRFLHDNALNTQAFPSIAEIQAEVVDATASLLHAPEDAAGFMTSGGTESILSAVKAARARGAAERGINAPEMVLTDTAHAAFHKAADYFGITVRKVPVGPDFRADVEAMSAAMNANTVLVVGSAPQYPHGVIDPIPELAAAASSIGANFHTDACMGGFVLPFMEMNGEDVAPWDFRVEGVTSISADVHKLGYAPKGASVLVHRTKELRRYQTFLFDDWLGGRYGSSGVLGSRSALPMATAWAVMHRLGIDGYMRLTKSSIETTRKMIAAVRAIEGLDVLGEPEAHIFAMVSSSPEVDVFAVGDALARSGWFHDRQNPPDSLHATVSAGNAAVVDDWIRDLNQAVAEVRGTRADDRSTNYASME